MRDTIYNLTENLLFPAKFKSHKMIDLRPLLGIDLTYGFK